MVEKIVYPGEIITDIASIKGITIIGPGLKRNEDQQNTLLVTKPGRLRFSAPNTYWVDHRRQKRYVPKRGDLVLGTLVKKSGDTLKVDIGGAEPASLSMLAFEGATKKQKPDVQVGDVIYGKLLNAHREMEPEMVCVDSYFKAGPLGPLPSDGHVVQVSTALATRLLHSSNRLLAALGKKIKYEIVVGLNGRIWINGNSSDAVLNVVRALEAAEQYNDAKIDEVCRGIK